MIGLFGRKHQDVVFGHVEPPALCYLATFVKLVGKWFSSQRKLMVVWTETRTLAAS
jgi:hypothetical protein